MSQIHIDLFIHPLNQQFSFEIEKGTSVKELCLHLKENITQSADQSIFDWEIQTDTNILLPLDHKINEPIGKLQIRYSDQLVQQNQNNIEEKEQNEKIIEKCVYLNSKSLLKVTLNKNSQLKDLLEIIKSDLNISESIEQWVCKSDRRGDEKLDENEILNDSEEIIQIQTSCQSPNENINEQSLGRIEKKKEVKLKLFLEIQDGLKTRNMEFEKEKQSRLEDLALDIINRLNLQDNDVAVDFFINGQQHNNPNVRRKSLQEINLQNNQVIQAKIRWIN